MAKKDGLLGTDGLFCSSRCFFVCPGQGQGEKVIIQDLTPHIVMSHSEEKCLRCDDAVLRLLPESSREIEFYICPKCGWNFAKEPGQQVHDRWLSPISLVLYLVTSDKDPREHIDQIADLFIEQRDHDELGTLVHEIDRELKEPTQRVTEILPFDHSPSEEIVREFLRGVSGRFKEHLRKPQEKKRLRTSQEEKDLRKPQEPMKSQLTKPQEFDGPCSVCGKPGYVYHYPHLPVSSCYCEDHTPDFTIQPILVLLVLGLLLALGWLMYTLFFK